MSPSTKRLACPSPEYFIEIFSNDPTTIGRVRNVCGFIGVSAITGVLGPMTDPPADSEYAEMLKLKDFYLEQPITEEYLLAPDLLDRTVEEFRRTQPFVAILNRAVQYAYDELM